MNDSINYLIAQQFEEIDTWDAVVTYSDNVPDGEHRAESRASTVSPQPKRRSSCP